MNRILVFGRTELFAYNKFFELHSILYDDWRKILELLGRGVILKI